MERFSLITGACVNTGVAIVEKFAGSGRNVIFTGRTPEKVAEAESKYRAKRPSTKRRSRRSMLSSTRRVYLSTRWCSTPPTRVWA